MPATTTKPRKPRTPPDQQELDRRRQFADTFPTFGKAQRRKCAAFLGIAPSTYDLYVSQGRIKPGIKYSARMRVWDCVYIRQLAADGIPPAVAEVS